MNDNKGQTIFLSVIGIATLLVAIIGATFAYFTTTMGTSTNGNVTAKTATLGTLSYTANGITANSNVLPGWSDSDTITLTLTAGDVDVEYECFINATTLGTDGTDLTDMYVTSESDSTTPTTGDNSVTGTLTTKTKLTLNGKQSIAKGKIDADPSNPVVHKINYTVGFAETGAAQNTQQGKSLAALVSCELKSTEMYYNNDNKGGIGTKPSGTPLP